MQRLNPVSRILTLLVLMAICGPLLAQGGAVGQVTQLEGFADVIRGGADPEEIGVGAGVEQADALVTRSEAFMEVTLNDGSSLTLDENTRLEISEYVPGTAPNSLVSLARGALRARVGAAFSSRRDSFKVQTREGTMGVQGTEFDVIAETGRTLIYVYEGLVSVTSRDPRYPETVILQAGDSGVITADAPPAPPVQFAASEEEAEAAEKASAVPASGGSMCEGGDCTQSSSVVAATPEPPTGPGPRQPPEPNPPGSGPLGQ